MAEETKVPEGNVRVWPKTDLLRKLLKHPARGAFRLPEGPEIWPLDSFTHRLIQDGDLLTEDPAGKKVKEK